MIDKHFFNPRSIAVIGASRNKKKIGAVIASNIVASGYRGKVYLVNPSGENINGKRSYANVTEVRGTVDIAVVAVPADAVATVLTDAGRKKIPYAIIISSGFAELGSKGLARDLQIRSIARKYRIRILGPNCLGLINTGARLNASFAGRYPDEGGISFISQSGALLVSLIDWAAEQGIGLRSLVSLGNQSGITDAEVVDYLANDPQTKVIGMYVEETNNGVALLKSLHRAVLRKPVLILKAGGTAEGRLAMRTHTGSLAGSPEIFSLLVREAGAVQVHDPEELFNALKLLSRTNRQLSKDVIILSNAGGPGIIAVDALSRTNLSRKELPESIQRKLKNLLPEGTAVGNPIDLMGDAALDRFRTALRVLSSELRHSTLLCLITPQAVTPVDALARNLVAFKKHTKANIIGCFLGGVSVVKARTILSRGGVPQFNYPYDALRALSLAIVPMSRRSGLHLSGTAREFKGPGLQPMAYAAVQKFLNKRKIPFLSGAIIRSETKVPVSPYPAVMKMLSPQIVHKAAAGGVIAPLANRTEAVRAFRLLKKRAGSRELEGVLVQKFVRTGTEFIIGLRRDRLLGAVIMLGIGGTHAEAYRDISLRTAPVSMSEALLMLPELRDQSAIPSKHRRSLAELVHRVSRLGETDSWISELDFNPVVMSNDKPVILDARIYTA